MITGKNGYVDISGSVFTARVYWSETYDEDAEISVVSITDIQFTVSNDNYSGTWYPGGYCSVDGTMVGTTSYSEPATHVVYGVRSSVFTSVTRFNAGVPFPWSSGEITHEIDGSKTVSIYMDLKMFSSTWQTAWGPYPTISGSVDIELTEISTGLVQLGNGTDYDAYEVYIGNGTDWERYIPYVGNGTDWDQCG